MKIQKISMLDCNNRSFFQSNERLQNNNSAPQLKSYNPPVIKDYNISFGGRTPEDFYAQDFNRENMPSTMKNYLNYDYENRQHIPPEQMMQEVFKYLELADNFDEVKAVYPDEELFQSLHDNYKKHTKNVLAEIKLAKEISDLPLFKDGSDDFGMYLLKKIYMNGKTLKEINKDFFENDINAEYKGLITKPINYETTSAFGIRYPKTEFWQSFISTRDEYKKFFVTLPKKSVDAETLQKETGIHLSSKNAEKLSDAKPVKVKRTRKYNIKPYQKKQLTDDIKEAQGNAVEIEKKIRRRFAKDDPEASFIVKYLSPIMAVSAERVHLSEEMRAFCENERENGKIGDDEYMFGRFWKHNPHILNYYAQTITDTIDLFEETYGEGGLIPINKDLEVIKSETENKKVVDNVNIDFLELLDYTQTILPEREQRYAEHERLQAEWNKHFLNRYGATAAESSKTSEITKTDEVQKAEPEKNSVDVQKLFKDTLKSESRVYPNDYASKYINYMMNNKKLDDEFKKAYVHFIGGHEIDDISLSHDDFDDKYTDIQREFTQNNRLESLSATFATIELLAKHGYKKLDLYGYDAFAFPNMENDREKIHKIIFDNKGELNSIYADIRTPLKPSELNAVVEDLYKQILTYTPSNNPISKDADAVTLMLKDAGKYKLHERQIKDFLKKALKKGYPFTKLTLNNDISEQERAARFERMMLVINEGLLYLQGPLLMLIVGKENFEKHITSMSEELKRLFITKMLNLTPDEKLWYEVDASDPKNDNLNFKILLK